MYTLITSWISKNIFLSISLPEKHLQVTALLFFFLIVHSWSVSAHHISHGFPLKWYHFHCLNSLHRRTTGRRINCLEQQQWQCTREMSQGLRGGQDAFRKELLPNITEGAQGSLLSPRHIHLNIQRPQQALPSCCPGAGPTCLPEFLPEPLPPPNHHHQAPDTKCQPIKSHHRWNLCIWFQFLWMKLELMITEPKTLRDLVLVLSLPWGLCLLEVLPASLGRLS